METKNQCFLLQKITKVNGRQRMREQTLALSECVLRTLVINTMSIRITMKSLLGHMWEIQLHNAFNVRTLGNEIILVFILFKIIFYVRMSGIILEIGRLHEMCAITSYI